MAGPKMEQARKALNFCLDNVKPGDRFGLINFATTVTRYRDALTEVTSEQVTQAKKWVDELEATGGTNINEALAAALEMRTKDEGRSFTVVFFTDGCPTVGETNPEKILKNTLARNTANTRIFTFGVGDDVNATLLDRLADQTRAWASYVKPAEDIEVKVSNLHTKIAHPVLTNLKLTTTADVKIKEVYPPQLPDLFSGSQLIVLGRYSGKGPTAIRLTGKVGKTEKEFVYEQTFPDKTGDERQLVEHLWARRKVGYLLNEIRVNGQQKELVDEVTKLARRHGIATPYTSYLIVPDGTTVPPSRPSSGVPDVRFGGGQFGQFGPPMVPPPGTGPGIGGFPGGPGAAGAAGALGAGGGAFGMNGFGGMGGMSGQFGGMMGMGGGLFGQFGVSGAMRGVGGGGGGGGGGKYRSSMPPRGGPPAGGPAVVRTKPDPGVKEPPANVLDFARALRQAGIDGQKVVPVPSKTDGKEREEARRKLLLYMRAADALARDEKELLQAGELGVDLSIEVDKLRRQQLLSETGQRRIAGREFQELAGTWIDRDFKETMTAVVVKAQSDAYFRLIERRAEAKDVLRLGNRIVWVTPSGSVLVVDPGEGKTKLEDREIDALFVPKK